MSIVDAAVAILQAGFADLPAALAIHVERGRLTATDADGQRITPPRFVIVTALDGTRSGETYRGRSDQRTTGVRLTITATLPRDADGSPDGRAEWMTERCEDFLDGARPVDQAGRHRYTRLVHEGSRYMGADEKLVSLISAYYVADFATTRS